MVAKLFAEVNGGRLLVPQADIIAFMLALAAGEMGEDAAADWFRVRLG